MLSVYKFPFQVDDSVTLELPRGAKVLKVDLMGGDPCMWALVDRTRAEERDTIGDQGEQMVDSEFRTFRIAGTGHVIKYIVEELDYIDSFKMRDGRLIFHVFELLT